MTLCERPSGSRELCWLMVMADAMVVMVMAEKR